MESKRAYWCAILLWHWLPATLSPTNSIYNSQKKLAGLCSDTFIWLNETLTGGSGRCLRWMAGIQSAGVRYQKPSPWLRLGNRSILVQVRERSRFWFILSKKSTSVMEKGCCCFFSFKCPGKQIKYFVREYWTDMFCINILWFAIFFN